MLETKLENTIKCEINSNCGKMKIEPNNRHLVTLPPTIQKQRQQE